MASEQLIKEELQNSATISRPDLSQSFDDDASTGAMERAAQLGVIRRVKIEEHLDHEDDLLEDEGEEDVKGSSSGHGVEDETDEGEGNEEDGEYDEEDDHGAAYESDRSEDDDEEAESEGEGASKRDPKVKNEGAQTDGGEEEEEAEDSDEGDSDEADADADAIEDAEGVGAVKIRPGETDDDESEASPAPSESSDDEWEEHAENNDDDEEEEEEEGEEEEEEEEEEGDSPCCIYCKQAQEHDPEVTGAFFACTACGSRAHEACARQHDNGPRNGGGWKCLDCLHDKFSEELDLNEDVVEHETNDNATTSATVRVAPNVSPAPRSMTANPESHSEDQTDNSPRTLRKRKTSPVDASESGMSLRKRRRNETDNLSVDGFGSSREVAGPSSARSLRIKPPSSLVSVTKKTRTSLILTMHVSGPELRRISMRRQKYTRKSEVAEKDAAIHSAVHVGVGPGGPFPILAGAYSQPFYSFFDKETEEQKGKPYGGILTEAEADTSKTFPTPDDRRRFDEARQKAEEEWRARLLATQAESEVPQKKPKKPADPASQIECIEFGGWEIDTWYAAPYPEEYSRNRVLYICEFCLKYMNSDYVAWRHKLKCPAKHPPGDEIYQHRSVSFFEVDGRKNPVYCQNLCLLAKLFLGSKTLYYDVEPFLFYVLCEYDEFGYHFVGYFSKEKRASSQNNVSCILTLPIHQRKGYGNLLIDFSYLLTRVEKKTGSPEKPLSDMGLVSYRNYWRLVMCRYFLRAMEETSEKLGLSIKKISDDTGMTADDVISALEGLRCLVRDPQTGLYAFRVDAAYCRDYITKWEAKKYVTLNPAALTWTPYVMGRGNATNFELGPALTAIAPREDEEEQKPAEAFVASLPNGDNASTPVQLVNGDANAARLAGNSVGGNGVEPAVTVLESTEPDENGQSKRSVNSGVGQDDSKAGEQGSIAVQVNNSSKPGDGDTPAAEANAESRGGDTHVKEDDNKTRDSGKSFAAAPTSHWTLAYDNILPTRFVVFPPVSSRGFNYTRPAIGRPLGSRTSSGNRARARYGAGLVRKVAAPRPKTSSSRKKTGGTGRGPGRWPKGTKKSDYGNADSGPGLPPAWIAQRAALAAAAEEKKTKERSAMEGGAVAVVTSTDQTKAAGEDETVEDTVQVHTPVSKLRNGLNTSVLSSGKGRSSPRLGKGKGALAESEDTVMVGVGE